ncbi:hypothetical protein B9Z55_017704 [Caenorhabditis nigoni]|uniref:Uncharacterized protein n=1 Tax=Caenorhabditis nigoni TaxID=1611254 RepID=A0A2G5TAM2_9PELO|nr:hypothetical protein B9Z55_017704 [Caenorhabditis nigoni]
MPTSGSYLHWINIAHTVPQVGFFASTVIGSMVLFLNLCGAQNKFGPYKYIVNSFTILGMIFAVVEVIVYPKSTIIISASYTFSYAATIALVATQFIYRYWAIFDVNKLRYFQGFYWLFWPAFCSCFGLQYALGTLHFLEMDTVSMDYFREEMQYKYEWNISEIPAMALLACDPSNGMVRWKNVAGVLNITFIVMTLYGIMIFCGWSMYSKMEEKIRNFSDELKNHQKQLFKTLVLQVQIILSAWTKLKFQITASTIILFTPLFLVILLPLFNPRVSFPSGAFLCSFTSYPAMDSIIVMYVVSQYRQTAKHLYDKFRRALKSSRHASTTVHTAVSGVFKKSKYGEQVLYFRCGIVSGTYGILNVHFVYRYLTLKRNAFVNKHFMPYGLILAVMYVVVHIAIWAAVRGNKEKRALLRIQVTGLCLHSSPEMRDYIREPFQELHNESFDDITFVAGLFSETTAEIAKRSWTGILLLTVIASYSIVLYFTLGYKIVTGINVQSTTMSKQTSQMQKQLFKALTIQTIIPICVSFMPCSLSFYGAALRIDFVNWVYWGSAVAVSFFPFLDPADVTLFLPTLRKRLISFGHVDNSISAVHQHYSDTSVGH